MRQKVYSRQVKAYCIEQYIGSDVSVLDISKEMNIPKHSIHRWINEFWFGRQYISYGRKRVIEIQVKNSSV